MSPSNIHPKVLRYIEMVEREEVLACKWIKLLVAYVRKCFKTEAIYIDDQLVSDYWGLHKYMPYDKVFEWQEFCMVLHLCTFWKDSGEPRWPILLLFCGRGNGKDGYMALSAFKVTSPYSGLADYDVDICANTGEQASRPLEDLLDVMEDTKNFSVLRQHYKWTKIRLEGRANGGVIRGRTNNPSSRDGMRSGMIVFNEVHAYQNYKNITVFKGGKGKTRHPRELYGSSNGDIREGVLDDMQYKGEQILLGEQTDNGMLPVMYMLDDEEEVHHEINWVKANPSYPYLPNLQVEIRDAYKNWQQNPDQDPDFMTKRMNLPQVAKDTAVTTYKNIQATYKLKNQPRELPDLTGWSCVAGLDYAEIDDWASVNLRFRDLEKNLKYDINHSWLCLNSRNLHRIKAPWETWAKNGHITLVDEVEIFPYFLTEWILEAGKGHNIAHLALDSFRYSKVAEDLEKIGFDAKERKNITLIRPSDIYQAVPNIESDFKNQRLIWGDNPPLRWATNNAKRVRGGKRQGTDTGNFYYAKQEPKSRKTDPFMAMVACSCIESKLALIQNEYSDMSPIFY